MHKERQSAGDKPIYEVELRPEDGLYPLPYMARQVDGAPWDEECTPGQRRGKASSRTVRAVARLEAMLEANSQRPSRERLTARRLFELLRAEG